MATLFGNSIVSRLVYAFEERRELVEYIAMDQIPFLTIYLVVKSVVVRQHRRMNAIACNCSEENVPACVKRLWELDLMHVALMTRLVTMLCRVSASASTAKDK